MQEGGFIQLLALPLIMKVMYKKGVKGTGQRVRRAGRGYDNKYKKIFPLGPIRNIVITKYFSCGSRFDCAHLTVNLPRIKDGAYVINMNNKQGKEIHWVSLSIGCLL